MDTIPSPTIHKGRPRGLHDVGVPETISGLTVEEFGGPSPHRLTVFTFSAMPLSITDSLAYSSKLIYTFPRGKIHVLGSASYLAFTTTSALATTLNSGVTVSYGFGTAAASNTTLALAMIDVLAGTGQTVPTFTSSTTINVASAAVTHHTLANPIPLDGSATALPLYFNLAVPTGSDIDGDATLTVTGTLSVHWINLGGWDYTA